MAIDSVTGSINGVQPARLLQPGEIVEIPSSGKPYRVKRLVGRDDYSCTCSSYQFPHAGFQVRTCKHLRELLGEAYELERMKIGMVRPIASTQNQGKPMVIEDRPKKRQRSENEPAPARKITAPPSSEKSSPESSRQAQRRTSGPTELMLAHTWDLKGTKSPEGLWASEKLDGVRAYWDGQRLWSRTGKEFYPPAWWKKNLPTDLCLDGELFSRRDAFDSTSGRVRSGTSSEWGGISFVVFDAVDFSKPLEARWELARSKCLDGTMLVDDIVRDQGKSHFALLEQVKIESREHLQELLDRVEALGGEGLMLRRPCSHYKAGRSHDLLKVKTFYDAEAVVVGYNEGEGRNRGRTGSLRCQMACGKNFDVGTGLTDSLREEPPKIGSIITYAFQELSHEGVPRFPSYKGVAVDKTKAKDAVVRSAALRAKT